MTETPPAAKAAALRPEITPWVLYLTFTKISLSGFGGTLFWARRKLVDDLKWLTAAEFNEYYGLGQVIPGANVFNMAILLGHRFAGVRGGIGAGLGFFSMPLFVVIGAALLYQNFGSMPLVHKALTGMFAVVVGLTIANAYKMTTGLPRRLRPWIFTLITFAAVGGLRWPLVWVMLAMAPVAIGFTWKETAALAADAAADDRGAH
jgi:chromate transporter